MELEVTTLKDLVEIANNAPEFKYESRHSPVTRMGETSREELEAEYDGNMVSISWQWPGSFEKGKGLRDECIHCFGGFKKGKRGIGLVFYADNACYSGNYAGDRENREIADILKKIASVAREKYLSQMKT